MSHAQPHWAKNYSSSHNVYFDFPPLMNDGRNFSGWQPGNAVNESIRRAEGITTNWDYRRYLTHNAEKIMDNEFAVLKENNTCWENGCIHNYPTRVFPPKFVEERKNHDASPYNKRKSMFPCSANPDYRISYTQGGSA